MSTPLLVPHHVTQESYTEMQCLSALQQVLNKPNATWASEQQKDAILAVMEHKTDVLAMLKTGGGKSMLAIIPAILSPNTGTILVLPLKSLMTDWKQKLQGMNIPYQEYNPSINQGQLNPQTNLILVSADRATFAGWRESITLLHQTLPITRMVFDEAHLPLLSSDFRSSLSRVNELRDLSMQLILLSGTVPPTSVLALRDSFGLLNNGVEIRQSSNRPELEYILEQPLHPQAIPSKIKEIVLKEQRKWTSKDRGLVFVAYMDNGVALSEMVNHFMSFGRFIG